MPKTKLPNVDLSPDQFRQMKWWAQKNGKKFNTWIRDTLVAAVPTNVARLQEQQQLGDDVKEEAFRQLEEQDEVMGLSLNDTNVKAMVPNGSAQTSAPLPIVTAPPPTTKLEGAPVYPPHPCRYLKREFGAFWDASKCQGTCGHPHPKQNGTVCQWPGGTARNCQYFAEFNKPGWQKVVPAGGIRR